ncbi:hypothetical protein [Rhizobium mesoamericanum]|uniref:hypothetical protein n=1 Tax=Rhizobium mesoamericanum TaxID=1079800 RepID=UPI0002FF523B|nr:hypothetical protein [Rhizobium mesoamericanum]
MTYCSKKQQRLQRRSDEAQTMVAASPGLVQAGRFYSTDNLDLIDWTFVDERLAKDGVFGFRTVPAMRIEDIRERLGGTTRWTCKTSAKPRAAPQRSSMHLNSE